MLRTGLQFGRLSADDPFYTPVKGRKFQSQRRQKQQRPQELSKSEENNRKSNLLLSPSPKTQIVPSDDDNYHKESSLSKASTLVSRSNLKSFLESTTPMVPAQYLSKTTIRGWRTCAVEFEPYFTLGDLWESFREWSAYGAGVPLVLDGSDCVVQYYVPYLSGIQLYGKSSMENAKPRLAGEESDVDCCRDSSSDGSSDYEMEQRSQHHITSGMQNMSISDESSTTPEGFSSDDSDAVNSQGCCLFEFLEQDAPYCREPLADKISDLASRYSGLKTLRSCDLLPSSWISVAWYPIYRIPTGSTLKDLDACFLTYHSLSAPMEGSRSGHAPFIVYPNEVDGIPNISLPAFGMASYKFKGSMWILNGVSEHQLTNSLMQAAENWLRLLRVNHPDFQFFASHGMNHR